MRCPVVWGWRRAEKGGLLLGHDEIYDGLNMSCRKVDDSCLK